MTETPKEAAEKAVERIESTFEIGIGNTPEELAQFYYKKSIEWAISEYESRIEELEKDLAKCCKPKYDMLFKYLQRKISELTEVLTELKKM